MSGTLGRVLFDECVPRKLMRELPDVGASHAITEGWAGHRNGMLLRAMVAGGFHTLITVDRNLAFQQNVAASGIAVIVLHAKSNRAGPHTVDPRLAGADRKYQHGRSRAYRHLKDDAATDGRRSTVRMDHRNLDAAKSALRDNWPRHQRHPYARIRSRRLILTYRVRLVSTDGKELSRTHFPIRLSSSLPFVAEVNQDGAVYNALHRAHPASATAPSAAAPL
jgi:hypothetical protein